FFSEKLSLDLDELVLIDAVLADPQPYLSDLDLEGQESARRGLRSLAGVQRQRLRRALLKAYGVETPADATERRPRGLVERHFLALTPGITLNPAPAGNLPEALAGAVQELLDQRWPRHPKFEGPATAARLQQTLESFYNICRVATKKVATDSEPADAL